MRANRAYQLTVTRGSRLARDRIDHLEILEIDSGEVALFWDTLPSQTRRLSRALKTDLAQMEADDFITKWRPYEVDR